MQLVSLAGVDHFQGTLFGLILHVACFVMAVSAAMGAVAGVFSDDNMKDPFIKNVHHRVAEGPPALFLMTRDKVLDDVTSAMNGLEFAFIAFTLGINQDDALFGVYSEGSSVSSRIPWHQIAQIQVSAYQFRYGKG